MAAPEEGGHLRADTQRRLLLLLGLMVRILGRFVRLGGVLLRSRRVLFSGLVFTFGVVFRRRAVGLRCIFVVLCCFIVGFFWHVTSSPLAENVHHSRAEACAALFESLSYI
jgi:hypothetical protein